MKEYFLKYKDAGVNIENSNILVNQIKNVAKKTYRPEIISQLGDFSSLCQLPKKYCHPILVSTTDGVGTKVRLAIDFNRHDVIGIDVVAMCVNDLVTCGAEPLFFLDYYASSKLNDNTVINLIKGISYGCLQAGCSLIGGETAEMPGIYQKKDYDIVGFCVGIVEKLKLIDPKKVVNGDVLIALSSNGIHSNGYSLIRKIIKINGCNLTTKLKDKPIIDYLLTPTRIYVKSIIKLLENVDIHAIAHITGGGIIKNIPRVLPNNTQAVINKSSWKWPIIFEWIKKTGNISTKEMYRTFNCGVGIVIILPKEEVNTAIELMREIGEKAWEIGNIKFTNNSSKNIILI